MYTPDNDLYFFNDQYDDELLHSHLYRMKNQTWEQSKHIQDVVGPIHVMSGLMSAFEEKPILNETHHLPFGTLTTLLGYEVFPAYMKKEFLDHYGYGDHITIPDLIKDYKTFQRRLTLYVGDGLCMIPILIPVRHGLLLAIPVGKNEGLSNVFWAKAKKEHMTFSLQLESQSDWFYTYKEKSALFTGNRIKLSQFATSSVIPRPKKVNHYRIALSMDWDEPNLLAVSTATYGKDPVEGYEYFEVSQAFHDYIFANTSNCKCHVFHSHLISGDAAIPTENRQMLFQIPFQKNIVSNQNLSLWTYDPTTDRIKTPMDYPDPNWVGQLGHILYPNIYLLPQKLSLPNRSVEFVGEQPTMQEEDHVQVISSRPSGGTNDTDAGLIYLVGATETPATNSHMTRFSSMMTKEGTVSKTTIVKGEMEGTTEFPVDSASTTTNQTVSRFAAGYGPRDPRDPQPARWGCYKFTKTYSLYWGSDAEDKMIRVDLPRSIFPADIPLDDLEFCSEAVYTGKNWFTVLSRIPQATVPGATDVVPQSNYPLIGEWNDTLKTIQWRSPSLVPNIENTNRICKSVIVGEYGSVWFASGSRNGMANCYYSVDHGEHWAYSNPVMQESSKGPDYNTFDVRTIVHSRGVTLVQGELESLEPVTYQAIQPTPHTPFMTQRGFYLNEHVLHDTFSLMQTQFGFLWLSNKGSTNYYSTDGMTLYRFPVAVSFHPFEREGYHGAFLSKTGETFVFSHDKTLVEPTNAMGEAVYISWYETPVEGTSFDNNIRDYMDFRKGNYLIEVATGTWPLPISEYHPIQNFTFGPEDFAESVYYPSKDVRGYVLEKAKALFYDNPQRMLAYLNDLHERNRDGHIQNSFDLTKDLPQLLTRTCMDNHTQIRDTNEWVVFQEPHTWIEYHTALNTERSPILFVDGKRIRPTWTSVQAEMGYIYIPKSKLKSTSSVELDLPNCDGTGSGKVSGELVLYNVDDKADFPNPAGFGAVASSDLLFYDPDTNDYLGMNQFSFHRKVSTYFISHEGTQVPVYGGKEYSYFLTSLEEYLLDIDTRHISLAEDIVVLPSAGNFHKKLDPSELMISTKNISFLNRPIGVTTTNTHRVVRIPDVSVMNTVKFANFREQPDPDRIRVYVDGLLLNRDASLYTITLPTRYGGDLTVSLDMIPSGSEHGELIAEYLPRKTIRLHTRYDTQEGPNSAAITNHFGIWRITVPCGVPGKTKLIRLDDMEVYCNGLRIPPTHILRPPTGVNLFGINDQGLDIPSVDPAFGALVEVFLPEEDQPFFNIDPNDFHLFPNSLFNYIGDSALFVPYLLEHSTPLSE